MSDVRIQRIRREIRLRNRRIITDDRRKIYNNKNAWIRRKIIKKSERNRRRQGVSIDFLYHNATLLPRFVFCVE
jgi:hypothetical protein